VRRQTTQEHISGECSLLFEDVEDGHAVMPND
jgi:hypothetical protein